MKEQEHLAEKEEQTTTLRKKEWKRPAALALSVDRSAGKPFRSSVEGSTSVGPS